jgi:phosphotransferase system enzyme I (PtsI)
MEVVHYFIRPDQVESEIQRARTARNAVIDELRRLQEEMPKDAPGELDALLDVHLMLLQDQALAEAINWISERCTTPNGR